MFGEKKYWLKGRKNKNVRNAIFVSDWFSRINLFVLQFDPRDLLKLAPNEVNAVITQQQNNSGHAQTKWQLFSHARY